MGGWTNAVWRLIAMTMVMTLFGCAASHESSDAPAGTVKPMERVRQGIVDVAEDLTRTNASSQELLKGERPARSRFSKDLQSTNQHVETLKTDASELHDRASDYFQAWSGDTITVTNAGVAKGTDPRRKVVKDKYDQFVGELVSARDIVIPLMSEFKMIEARSDYGTMGDDVRKADAEATQAIQHLNEAIKKLDELQNLAQSKRN